MPPRLLLFEPYVGGHRGLYLDALLDHRPDVLLDVVVSAAFREAHPDTHERLRAADGVTLHSCADADPDAPLHALDRRNGYVLRHYAERLRPAHALCTYFDHLQLALGSGLRFDFPLRLSGLYFRPSFHYGALEGGPPASWPDRARALRKRLVLRWARRNPHLDTLFSLDPFAARAARAMGGYGTPVFLPDPVPVPSPTPTGTAFDRAEPGRRHLLLFGVLGARKGVGQVCEALGRLRPDEQQRLTLALVGPLDDALRSAVERLGQASRVQVLVDDRFVSDGEIQHVMSRADLVLLAYQRHVGSSNVLVRAAAAGVPVLATDYGLVGAQVRAQRLGLTVDAADPARLAGALAAWLADAASVPFDAAAARAFHAQNTAEAYARTIFTRLLHPS